MTQVTPFSARDLLIATHDVPVLARVALKVAAAVTLWDLRRRTRKHLRTLDDRLLQDVGLTRAEAQAESAHPFWRV